MQNRTIFVGIVVDNAVTMNTITSTKFLNDLKCELGGTVVRLALTQDVNSSQFGKCSIMSSLLPDTSSTFLKVLIPRREVVSDVVVRMIGRS